MEKKSGFPSLVASQSHHAEGRRIWQHDKEDAGKLPGLKQTKRD